MAITRILLLGTLLTLIDPPSGIGRDQAPASRHPGSFGDL